MGFRSVEVTSKRISIHYKIFYSILLFLIIPFILSFYMFDKPLERAIESRIGSSAQEALMLAGMNMEYILEDMFQSTVDISTNPDIARMLKNPSDFSEYEKLQLKAQTFGKRFNYTAYVAIMNYRDFLLTSRYTEKDKLKEFQTSDWYKDLAIEPNKSIWLFNPINYTLAYKQPIISLAKTIVDVQTSHHLGIILFSAAEDDFAKYLSKLEGEVYLIDESGMVISSSEKSKLGKMMTEELEVVRSAKNSRGQAVINQQKNTQIINYYRLNQTGWTILQINPYERVFKEILDIRKGNIITSVLIFAFFIMVTLFISYSISRPLVILGKKMRDAENKQFSNQLSLTGPREISIVIASYNQMLGQIKELLQRVKEQYKQKEDMRFRALQAQIKPHFILNVLNNIKWMAYIRNNNEVGQMISRLAGIIEGSIGKNGSLVTLRQEVAYIEDYVALMKMKYNEKVTVEYDIPDNLMSAEVIKFMLQPVIENSIRHGIEPLQGKGSIRISAMSDLKELHIFVTDNGVGMAEEKLCRIREWLLDEAEEDRSESIGIKNVHDRIRLQYGERYGITLNSERGQGTTVEYLLPKQSLQ